MNHVGEILRILEIMVKMDKHVVFNFQLEKNKIERDRERPKLQLGWLQLCQNPISMTLGVFDGN